MTQKAMKLFLFTKLLLQTEFSVRLGYSAVGLSHLAWKGVSELKKTWFVHLVLKAEGQLRFLWHWWSLLKLLEVVEVVIKKAQAFAKAVGWEGLDVLCLWCFSLFCREIQAFHCGEQIQWLKYNQEEHFYFTLHTALSYPFVDRQNLV